MSITIAVDFDGTLVEHCFPDIGPEAPSAVEWCKRFVEAGASLILWTMRSDGQESGSVLSHAADWCIRHGIALSGVNENRDQHTWTSSPKAYAHIYIDDAAFGCPLRQMGSGKWVVDWDIVGPAVMEKIAEAKA